MNMPTQNLDACISQLLLVFGLLLRISYWWLQIDVLAIIGYQKLFKEVDIITLDLVYKLESTFRYLILEGDLE